MIRRLFALVLLSALSGPAAAVTLTVGGDGACDYSSLRDAVYSVSGNGAGPHLIRVTQGSYGLSADPVHTGRALWLVNPQADIEIAGGYPDCATATPVAGGRSNLYAPPGNVGILAVSNDASLPRRNLTLRALTLSGGERHSGVVSDAGYGGAILVSGNISLILTGATDIRNNVASIGGGIDASGGAIVYLTENSSVTFNEAEGYVTSPPPTCIPCTPNTYPGLGGGIHAGTGSVVYLWDGSISNNDADIGGGIAIEGELAHLHIQPVDAAGEQVSISHNVAHAYDSGSIYFPTTQPGLGGGIHSSFSDIDTFPGSGVFTVVLADNSADLGGGIYIESDQSNGGNVTWVTLNNALFDSNVAHDRGGAMYSHGTTTWRLDSTSSVPCNHPELGTTLCSLAYDNRALNEAVSSLGAGMIFLASGSPDAVASKARIRRTAVIDNDSIGGSVAVAMGDFSNELRFERSILAGNSATLSNGALLRSFGPMHCYYCTITNNSVDNLFYFTGTTLYLQGSILWNPGAAIRAQTGPDVATNGCLVSHTGTGLPAGSGYIIDPKLDADFMPGIPSIALDACDDFQYTAISDVYHHAPTDINAIDDLYGVNDLGAIEQIDVIFFAGFGSRLGGF